MKYLIVCLHDANIPIFIPDISINQVVSSTVNTVESNMDITGVRKRLKSYIEHI